MRAALNTAVLTFLVVVAAGTAASFAIRPQYLCSERILLSSNSDQPGYFNPDNPLSGLVPVRIFSIPDQIAIIKGDNLVRDACRDASVPRDAVSVDVRQIPGTYVVNIVAESSTPAYAERLAQGLPNTYEQYQKRNDLTVMNEMFTAASARLKEQKNQLAEVEASQEHIAADHVGTSSNLQYSQAVRDAKKDVDTHLYTVNLLTKSIETLRHRPGISHISLLIVSPAKAAQKITTNRQRIIITAAIAGVILGLSAAGTRLFFTKRKRTIDLF